jgi:DNA gyrase subunit A
LDASDAIVGATLVPPALEEEIEEVEIQSGDGLVTTVEVIVETSEVEVSETEGLDGDTEA